MAYHKYNNWTPYQNQNNTTMSKVQKQFWFTKSALMRKLKKKEDEHIVISDIDLDSRIELFKAIQSSTKELKEVLCDYQTKVYNMAHEETCYGKLLKECGKQDQSKAGEMMLSVGKCLTYTAQQRLAMRNPLIRLLQEVETFQLRAVEDTLQSVEEMEKVRTEYRGALMWMKNISQDFNPEHYNELEKFREVQATVRMKKQIFDRLKVKCLQKIELLDASRCNMFSHALTLYQNSLSSFSQKSEKALTTIAEKFEGYQPYSFQVIKELAIPEEFTQQTDELQKSGNHDNADLLSIESKDNRSAKDCAEVTDTLLSFLDEPHMSAADSNVWSSVDLSEKPFSWDPIASEKSGTSGHSNSVSQFLPSELLKGIEQPQVDLLTTDFLGNHEEPIKGKSSLTSNEFNQPLQETSGDSKRDWYRIFQDLDPLSNEGNTFFKRNDQV